LGKFLNLVFEFKYMNLWFCSIYIAIHRFVVVKFGPRRTLCLFLAYNNDKLMPTNCLSPSSSPWSKLFLWKESHAKARIVLSQKTIKRPGELAPASRSLTAQDPKSKKVRTGKRDVPFATKVYPKFADQASG
jgi:hypothetical protein